jgi:hypothetical protein
MVMPGLQEDHQHQGKQSDHHATRPERDDHDHQQHELQAEVVPDCAVVDREQILRCFGVSIGARSQDLERELVGAEQDHQRQEPAYSRQVTEQATQSEHDQGDRHRATERIERDLAQAIPERDRCVAGRRCGHRV